MSKNRNLSQEEKVAEILNRVNANKKEGEEQIPVPEVYTHKKNLSEQEKVAEILKRSNVSYDQILMRSNITLNTRCRKCGRTLSSLERITFGNTCYECMKEEVQKSRDSFMRKYILIAFAFIVAIVLGGFCANAGNKALLIVGVVVSALVTVTSLIYVFSTNVDRILPNAKPKVQITFVLVLAVGIAIVIAVLNFVFKYWLLYVLLMIAVGAYIGYLGYCEMQRIKEKDNLLSVYRKKSRDKNYIEDITDAIETRALQNEKEQSSVDSVVKQDNDDEAVDSVVDENNVVEDVAKTEDNTVADHIIEENVDDKKDVEPDVIPAEQSEDSGDFCI